MVQNVIKALWPYKVIFVLVEGPFESLTVVECTIGCQNVRMLAPLLRPNH